MPDLSHSETTRPVIVISVDWLQLHAMMDPAQPPAASRTGGRLLADCLVTQGCDRVFSEPGESFLAVLAAAMTQPGVRLLHLKTDIEYLAAGGLTLSALRSAPTGQ